MNRSAAYDLLARVEDELDAAQFALSYVLRGIDVNANFAQAAIVEGVTGNEFVLRLFSEFEGILRDYWRGGLGRITRPDMHPLMESIAHRRDMNQDDLDQAHEIREYRNDVIHEAAGDARYGFSECKRALAMYLRWLPLQW